MSAIVSPYSSSSAVPKWEVNRRGGKGERGGGGWGRKGRDPKALLAAPSQAFLTRKKTIRSLPGGCSSRLLSPGTVDYLAYLPRNLREGLNLPGRNPWTLDFSLPFFFFFFLFATVTVTQLFPRGSFCNRLFFFFFVPLLSCLSHALILVLPTRGPFFCHEWRERKVVWCPW